MKDLEDKISHTASLYNIPTYKFDGLQKKSKA